MNLVSWCSVRDLDVLASTASESPEKPRYDSQIPLSAWNEQQPRTGRPVGGQPAGSFTQHTDKFVIDDDDMDSNTATESDLSLKSRSLLHKVNDRVRKILDQSSKDAMQDSDKNSLIWWMFISSTLEASVFMGKNYSEKLHSIKNTRNNLTLEQMFDISEMLIVGQSYEIFWVTPIDWEDSSWKHSSLVSDEEVISLSHAKVHVFSDSVFFVLERWIRTQHQILLGKKNWVGSRVHHNTELWTQLMGADGIRVE